MVFLVSVVVFAKIYEGLSILNSTKLDPRTCSERKCHSSEYLLYATWISSKVDTGPTWVLTSKFEAKSHFTIHFQIKMGCDCCEVNNELVPDKHTWIDGQRTYGKNVKRLFLINISNTMHNLRVLQRRNCSQTRL